MRCRETANIAKEVLDTEEILIDERLRERNFGEWEGTHHDNYHVVWAEDKSDPFHTTNGVESVTQVRARTTKLVVKLEAKYNGETILFVSHGDTIQMKESAFQKKTPPDHQLISHLKPGELRELLLAG